MVNQFTSIKMLGDAQDFLEAFDWTDNALRGLEYVNTNRMHTMHCGSLVINNIDSFIKLIHCTAQKVICIRLCCSQIW